MISSLGFIIVGLGLLVLGGHLIVRGGSALAILFRIAPSVVGLTIVAAGTSLPELFVGWTAAMENHPDLLIGNVIGSNIVNIALVVGLSAVLLPIMVSKQSLRIEWPTMFLLTLLAFFFLYDLKIDRWEGVILVIGTIAAILIFVYLGKKEGSNDFRKETKEMSELTGKISHQHKGKSFAVYTITLLIGFISLRLGSEMFVKGASHLAQLLHMSERIIGLTVVAIGTSLPELFVSIMATFKGRSDVAIGNILGSNIFNLNGILGICTAFKPLSFSAQSISYDAPWFLGIALFFFLCMVTRKINRPKGVALISLYLIYTYTLF